MTFGELRESIEKLQGKNDETWAASGNINDLIYCAGFDAACEEILGIMGEGEKE